MSANITSEKAEWINHIFSELENHGEEIGSANQFVESLRMQWESKEWLSPKQIAALEKIYNRI